MDLQLATLALIDKRPDQLSWYQLDRLLAANGVAGGADLIAALQTLREKRFVEVHGAGSMPCYRITEAGSALLKAHREPPLRYAAG